MNQSTATIKKFSGLRTIEQICAQLDFVFARLQDSLQTNPATYSLLDPKAAVPNHVAGDFVMDYRDGKVSPGMSDGKTVQPFDISTLTSNITPNQHGALDASIFDKDGNFVSQMHSDATSTLSGFMSATDKVKLTGITASSTIPVLADASAGTAGVSTNYSRADHTHQVSVGSPVTLSTSNSAGTSTNLARADHVHAHGNLVGGGLHAVASSSSNGFMVTTDKIELDRLNALNLGVATSGSNRYILATIGGTAYAFGPGILASSI